MRAGRARRCERSRLGATAGAAARRDLGSPERIIGSSGGRIYAIDASSGKIAWEQAAAPPVSFSPDGEEFAMHPAGIVYYSARTGLPTGKMPMHVGAESLLWSRDGGAPRRGGPAGQSLGRRAGDLYLRSRRLSLQSGRADARRGRDLARRLEPGRAQDRRDRRRAPADMGARRGGDAAPRHRGAGRQRRVVWRRGADRVVVVRARVPSRQRRRRDRRVQACGRGQRREPDRRRARVGVGLRSRVPARRGARRGGAARGRGDRPRGRERQRRGGRWQDRVGDRSQVGVAVALGRGEDLARCAGGLRRPRGAGDPQAAIRQAQQGRDPRREDRLAARGRLARRYRGAAQVRHCWPRRRLPRERLPAKVCGADHGAGDVRAGCGGARRRGRVVGMERPVVRRLRPRRDGDDGAGRAGRRGPGVDARADREPQALADRGRGLAEEEGGEGDPAVSPAGGAGRVVDLARRRGARGEGAGDRDRHDRPGEQLDRAPPRGRRGPRRGGEDPRRDHPPHERGGQAVVDRDARRVRGDRAARVGGRADLPVAAPAGGRRPQ
ncbi:hypothetical protein [Nannocystis sp.]|uniref:hypothetical protein n=1 Tax=Nannocystis sp. TaxID=1962667 RepID=UPI00344FE06A